MVIGFLFTALTLFLAAYLRISIASSLLVVDLGYELHQVFSLNQTTGLYNFSNIRYAAPPLGSLRFRAPLPPKVNRSEVQTGSVGMVSWRIWLARWSHSIQERNPNAALHDQRLGLIWGPSFIRSPHTKGFRDRPSLFQQAILQSPRLGAEVRHKEERTFRQYLKLLNVSSIEDARQISSEKLIAANAYQVSSSLYGTFTYGPVVDGIFVLDLPGKMLLLRGEFDHNVKVLNGHTMNKALMYTPPSSLQDSGLSSLVDGHFPGISESMKGVILNVYPPILDRNHGYSSWLERDSLALSDICFQCKSYDLNHAHKDNSYSCVFSIFPAMHWLDHPYTFYIKGEKPIAENPIFQVVNETVAYILQDYFTSFAKQASRLLHSGRHSRYTALRVGC
ncbi:hypothetical protein ETB97_002296 [Aspergillus alliaceus]|uniref:Carboxylesterase type B domain-containing protein n=1 Tax=Petromyces alliaceus TaxID=209559 RepID=A0A8H6AGI9_PETAA|nr:hypothetical protein ETB97_002296 [Aspergillus burnettii]